MSSVPDKEKSLAGNLWKAVSFSERNAELIAQKYGLSPLVSSVLTAKGISPDEVGDFITPKLQRLMPEPYVLKDMEIAAERIAKAIQNNEKIGIIGDYDVDGATSTSVLRLFLEANGNVPFVHIPERDEGYGPSIMAFDEFAAQDVNFVITVDCGTTAFDVFDYAKEKDFEIVVLDHHEAEIKRPNVLALVNPKRLDEEDTDYPYLKYMAAVGVVFMTVVAVNRVLRQRGFYQNHPEPPLMNWLDLVALGTVCDVVPLLGLNRAFVRQGLKVMAQRRNLGLKALFDKSNVTEAPRAYHLGFVLGPRINACGRVGEAALGNRLLCARSEVEANLLADKLNQFNDQRKEIESYVLLEAIEQLEGQPQSYPIAFVTGKDWHQGVIGIVAGKLKERYNLPAFVMSIEPDEVKGSARSIPNVDLGALIIAAKERGLLTKGGGHIMAAGFSLNEDKIEDFRTFVGTYVKEKLGDEEIVPILEIEACLDVGGATLSLVEELEQLEPFGAGNAEPRLMLKNVHIKKPALFGSGHVRCFLTGDNGASLKAMAFRVADSTLGKELLAPEASLYDVVGVLRRDTWQGRNSLQFIIEDARKGGNK